MEESVKFIADAYEEAIRVCSMLQNERDKYNYLVRHDLEYGICAFIDRHFPKSGLDVCIYLDLPTLWVLCEVPFIAIGKGNPILPLLEYRLDYLKQYIK